MSNSEHDDLYFRDSVLTANPPPPDGIEPGQVGAAIRENYRLILGTAAIVFTTTMIVTLLSRMDFQSTGRLYLGELDDKPQARSEDFLKGGQGDVYSEIEIVKSRSLVTRAVLKSGLNVNVSPEGWSPPRYWRWLMSFRDASLLDVGWRQLVATDTFVDPQVQDPQRFLVLFKNKTNFQVLDTDGRKLTDGQLGVPVRIRATTLKLLAGTEEHPQPGARFQVVVSPTDDTVDSVLRVFAVSAAKATTSFEPVKVLALTFSSRSPKQAASFLNELMLGYLEQRQTWKTEDAGAAEHFVTKQLQDMQRSLQDSEQKLADFRRENQAVAQETQASAVVTLLATHEQQRIAARLELSALEQIQANISRRGNDVGAYMIADGNDPVLQGLVSNLAETRQQLTEVSAKFSDVAPDVVQQRAKVSTQVTMIRNYIAGRLSRAREQVAALDSVIEQYEAKLQSVPGAELGLAKITRQNDVYSHMYSYLLERQQQTGIIKASTISKNRIVDLPQISRREESPKLAMRLASAPLGLLLGTMFVILRLLFSKAIRTESEVRSLLGATRIFANIPQMARSSFVRASLAPADNGGFAEGFRTLRTNLCFALPSGHGKAILITSPMPGDGKTMTTLSLASALAADGKRVLVIDADLRKPSHHLLTGATVGPGLRNLLTGSGTEDSVTRTTVVGGATFDSIHAGIGGSIELLATPHFSQLLVRARHRYDYILLDSPSYPIVADALVVAPQCDFVLSVIRIGNTSRAIAEEHLRGLLWKTRDHAFVVNCSQTAVGYGYPKAVSRRRLNPTRLLEG